MDMRTTTPSLARLLVALLAAMTLVLAACGGDDDTIVAGGDQPGEPTDGPDEATTDPETDGDGGADEQVLPELVELREARAAWAEAGIKDYRYALSRSCECDDEAFGPRIVTVRDGEVVETTWQGEPSQYPGHSADELFAMIEDTIAPGIEVRVTYDHSGFPVEGALDAEAAAADGGFVWSTADFEIIDGDGGPTTGGEAGALDTARSMWQGSGIADYTMTYEPECFCPRRTVTVIVVGNELVDVAVESEAGPPLDESEALTVDDLFDLIDDAITSGAVLVEVDYDPATGRPTNIYVDRDEMMADEEFGVTVTAFEDHGREPDVLEPDALEPDALEPEGGRATGPVDAAACDAIGRFEALAEPTDAVSTQAALAELDEIVADLLAHIPADLADGATEFAKVIDLIDDIAASNGGNLADIDPGVLDERLSGSDIDIDAVDEFASELERRCR